MGKAGQDSLQTRGLQAIIKDPLTEAPRLAATHRAAITKNPRLGEPKTRLRRQQPELAYYPIVSQTHPHDPISKHLATIRQALDSARTLNYTATVINNIEAADHALRVIEWLLALDHPPAGRNPTLSNLLTDIADLRTAINDDRWRALTPLYTRACN